MLVTFERLGAELLLRVGHQGALAAGLIFWPQLAAVLISAALLGVVIRTRLLPILILAGMAALIGGGGLLATAAPAGMPVKVMAAAGLLGLGAGATVSPGLYLAAFPLPSTMVARIFALVELVRSVADFILAPVMQGLARVYAGGRTPTAGALHASMWTTVTLTLVLTGAGIWLYLTSGAGLPRPDLERWVDKKETAMQSPPLFAAIGHKAEAASRPSQRKRLRR